MKESINLVGIIPESDLYKTTISWRDVEKIASDGVQLGQFIPILREVLIQDFNINIYLEIPWEILFKALNHINFISNVPRFLNYRNTDSNIKSFGAAIILFKTNTCYLRDINAALNAYTYVAKLINDFYIPLHPGILLLILRIMGRWISEDLLHKWIKSTDLDIN